MEIYLKLTDKNKLLSLALGVFDGVHRGHVEVIKSAVDFAHKNSSKSAIITFKTHPQSFFNPNFTGCITTLEQRLKIFENLGVDYCYLLDFNEIKNISGEDYLKEILIKNFSPISISTGFNHHFGANKSGTTELLSNYASKYGYKYDKIQPVIMDNEIISSSIIRKLLLNGDIEKANYFMGRKFSVIGEVQKGAKQGREIGFKTANLEYPEEFLKIPLGVYSVNALINNNTYNAIANFGIKPTLEGLTEKPILEVHLLDFDNDIYGQVLNVEFLKFIRPEKKFQNIDELKQQIQTDISQI